MKKGALIVNVILAIAVIILFYLVLSGKKSATGNDGPVVTNNGGLKILYFNFDSLQENYQLFKDLEKKFEEDNLIRQDKIRKMQSTYEKKVRDFEAKRPSSTNRELEKMQQELYETQQRLQMDAQDLSEKAAIQQNQMAVQFMDSLTVFFNEYGKNKGVDLIMTNQQAGGIFYSNPQFDITADVTQQLNARYMKSKKQEGK